MFHVGKMYDFNAPRYSLGKITRMFRHQKDVQASIRKILKRDLQFHRDAEPPVCMGTNPQFRAKLKAMLLQEFLQTRFDRDVNGEVVLGVQIGVCTFSSRNTDAGGAQVLNGEEDSLSKPFASREHLPWILFS